VEGVVAVDPLLRITFLNRAFAGTMEVQLPLTPRTPLVQVVRDHDLLEMFNAVFTSGEPLQKRLILSVGGARTFAVQVTPLAGGPNRGAIGMFYDITEIERLERIRKDFVANVSHELRTPLAGIIGYADTLLDGALEDLKNNRQFVEIIRSNAVRLNSIAADLLILSELESGTEPVEPDTISVRAVLDTALATVAGEARARNVSLVRDEIENAFVSGSRLRLEQAILNLIANAIKFNRPGGEVRVRATTDGGDDGHVAIVISDTGVGIPSQDLPRIFERFYRVDKARSRQVGGTGLGLSIVKHVVERMNGAITVESQLGRGSAFTLRLPIVLSNGASE
jgi:two-component system phosphate regulon sensor histidine kinase PhoR